MSQERSYEILVVEDNPADVELTRAALERSGMEYSDHHVGNGEDALTFLHKGGDFSDAPTPDLVMLDLNMPKKGGWDVLRAMKSEDDLKEIPVVVMSTSEADEDVLKAYDLQPSHMISKFDDVDEYVRIAKLFEGYWFGILKLPDES